MSVGTDDRGAVRYAGISIGAAIATIVLKGAAYLATGSIGLLSDAAESIVNLFGAVMAFCMISLAARPPDDEHSYGHDKAEFFSSGVEGALIVVAAVGIVVTAIRRFFNPVPLERVGIGIAVSTVATVVNFVVARLLLRASRRYDSLALEADGRHLMTDVWTSGGVIVAIAVAAFTGWHVLDPIIALFVAANIVREGVKILRRTVSGLMDSALPEEDIAGIEGVLEEFRRQGIEFHALRTRRSGTRRFVNIHVLVPGEWTVHEGHQLLERFEARIRECISNAVVFTHLESLDDEASWHDLSLDR